MKAKVVVFPIRGRNWCFSRAIEPSSNGSQTSNASSTFKQLYNRLFSTPEESKVELMIDFAANKMNGAWSKLEQAPQGTIKSKIHGLGLMLLSRVKPSEVFLKSISKEVDRVDIVFPSGLNPRLVRRRLRHIAFRGSVTHKKYFYGSAILLPLTSVFMVLPLPNVPFFWVLFRTYSHWRASQGSEKLLHLVSDTSAAQRQSVDAPKGKESSKQDSDKSTDDSTSSPWDLQPSEELERLIQDKDDSDGVMDGAVSEICQKFCLNNRDVVKYRSSM